MMMRFISIATIFCVLGVTHLATADVAIVLPLGGDDASSTMRRAAQEAVVDVLESSDSPAHADQADQEPSHWTVVLGTPGCDLEGCASELLASGQAAVAIAGTVWMRAMEPFEVAITVRSPDQPAINVTANVDEAGSIQAAARAAMREALLRLEKKAVEVRIDGEPHGAGVVVDHTPVGTLPFAGVLSAGHHELSIAYSGFQTDHRSIEIQRNTGPFSLEVHLQPDDSSGPEASAPPEGAGTPSSGRPGIVVARSSRVGHRGIALALGLAGGGAFLSIDALALARRHHLTSFGDRSRARLSLRPGLVATYAILGGASIAAGIVFYVLLGRDANSDVSNSSVQASFGADGFHLRF